MASVPCAALQATYIHNHMRRVSQSEHERRRRLSSSSSIDTDLSVPSTPTSPAPTPTSPADSLINVKGMSQYFSKMWTSSKPSPVNQTDKTQFQNAGTVPVSGLHMNPNN